MAFRVSSLPPLDNPAHLPEKVVHKLYELFQRLDVVIKEKYQPMLQRGDVQKYRESGAEDITALRANVSRLLWTEERAIPSETLCLTELLAVIRTLLHENEHEINAIRVDLEMARKRLEEEAHARRLALPVIPAGFHAGHPSRNRH